MSETDEIFARLTALETVVRQLITHLAVRADDPASWVETRKVLALRMIEDTVHETAQTERIRDALAGFFDQAETIAAEYSYLGERGTSRPLPR